MSLPSPETASSAPLPETSRAVPGRVSRIGSGAARTQSLDSFQQPTSSGSRSAATTKTVRKPVQPTDELNHQFQALDLTRGRVEDISSSVTESLVALSSMRGLTAGLQQRLHLLVARLERVAGAAQHAVDLLEIAAATAKLHAQPVNRN